jgi:hypothetical protein
LPPDDQMMPAIKLFASHHKNFCDKFAWEAIEIYFLATEY